MRVIFGSNWFYKLFMRGKYDIIDTDYENYSIIFVS